MNLPTYEEVMQLTDTVSNYHLLQPDECRAMYDALVSLPNGATVVEIGCDLGRSSSMIAQVALVKDFLTIHVDPWQDEPEKAALWMGMMCEQIAYRPFIVLRGKTEEMARYIWRLSEIDLAYIDGCHDEAVVEADLAMVATRVKQGGLLAAHDYPSAGVSEAIDSFIARGGWMKQQQAGGLGVWRRA